MSAPHHIRLASVAMAVGLALTVVVTVIPFLGTPVGALILRHVQAGYPSYSVAEAQRATAIYLVGLAVIGLIGATWWIVVLVTSGARKRSAPWLATVALVLAVCVGLFDLTVRDTSGDTGLPPLVGWLGLLPCLPGIFAVVALWREQPASTSARASSN